MNNNEVRHCENCGKQLKTKSGKKYKGEKDFVVKNAMML